MLRPVLVLLVGSAAASSTVRWQDLSVTLGTRQTLLHPSSGAAEPGRLLAVLGPSGAGKSTFLAALSGSVAAGGGKGVAGSVEYEADGKPVRGDSGEVARLGQEDHFFSQLTVRETLRLAAALQQAPDTNRTVREATVQSVLDRLALANVADCRVGDRARKSFGISGGERRRLSVACELMTSPRFLVADEPTTGLDAFGAERVVRLLRNLAQDHQFPAVLTLHQPRATIWAMLDDVMLIAPGGKVVYHGPTSQAVDYFDGLGYPCPEHTNVAEHLIDLVSVDHEDQAKGARDHTRCRDLAVAWNDHRHHHHQSHQGAANTTGPSLADRTAFTWPPQRRRLSLPRRFGCLLLRSWRTATRERMVFGARLCVSAGLAGIFGEVFGRFRETVSARCAADRIALLSYASINMAMMATTKTLELIGRERHVVERERSRYAAGEYALSKLVAEVPLDCCFAALHAVLLHQRCGLRLPRHRLVKTLSITTAASAALGLAVGSLADPEVAMAMGTPLMICFMIVGIKNPSGTDADRAKAKAGSNGRNVTLLKVLAMASPIRWSIDALLISELQGAPFERGIKPGSGPPLGALALVRNGDDVLARLGLGADGPDRPPGGRPSSRDPYARANWRLATIALIEVAVAVAGLTLRRPQYLRPVATSAVPEL